MQNKGSYSPEVAHSSPVLRSISLDSCESVDGYQKFSPEVFLDEEREVKLWKLELESQIDRVVLCVIDFDKISNQEAHIPYVANWDTRETELSRNDQKIAHAAKACADIAKNIIAIANKDCAILEDLNTHIAVSALKIIAKSFSSNNDGIPPLNDNIQQWVQLAENGLRNALKSTVYHPTYQDGYLINKEQYIHSKFTDIQIGINIRQSQFHQGI